MNFIFQFHDKASLSCFSWGPSHFDLSFCMHIIVKIYALVLGIVLTCGMVIRSSDKKAKINEER